MWRRSGWKDDNKYRVLNMWERGREKNNYLEGWR